MATFQITGPNGKKYRVQGENPSGAMAALKKMIGEDTPATVNPETNQPNGVPEYVPPGVEGYDPKTGEVTTKYGMGESAAFGAADTTTFGFGDELASYVGSGLTGVPRDQVLREMRGDQKAAQEQNPGSYFTGQIAGGVAQGVATAPLTASARVAGSTLVPRVIAGMADGAVAGGIYGAGSGETAKDRAVQAGGNAMIGGFAGGAFPLVSAGASKLFEVGRNALAARPIARQSGTSPEALRLLGSVMDADGSLGPMGQANMARAGADAMLADAGPNARAVLDTAIQRGGPGAVDARRAIADRTGRAANSVDEALNTAMGKPGESLSREMVVYGDKTNPMSLLYKKAYETPIDYSHPAAMRMEQAIKGRVPPQAIAAANNLMRVEGNSSKQIMAHLADDGSVVFETLPDVRQLDYITRGLNEVAEHANGQGKLGGTTATGRAYANLSREIRNDLKEVVPEYKTALDRAATEIGKKNAQDFGSKLLSPSVTRDEVAEFVADLPLAEQQKLVQGVRSQIDDAMARVTRTVQDDDTGAREAIKAIKDLSSRANREKLTAAIGPEKATALFDEIDRAATSFDLRASVTENSKTFARQATERRIGELTGPGAVGKAAQGEPIKATKSIVQALTGMTPERIRGKEDAIYSEIARALTRPGGAGQRVYDAAGKLGKTDQATKLMADRISRALAGPRFSYPAATLGVTYMRQ